MRVGLTFERKSDFRPPPGAPPDASAEMEMDYTIDELGDAIRAAGHELVPLGSAARLLALGPSLRKEVDLVFNYSVGFGGRARETWIPAILDVAGVPFVGGDAICLGIASDKHATKALAARLGIPTPDSVLVLDEADLASAAFPPFPLIVKPNLEGSSIGLTESSVVRDAVALRARVRECLAIYRQPVLVERFIAGAEATVCLLGDPLEPFGVVGVAIDGTGELGERFLHGALKGHIERTAGLVPSGLPPATEDALARHATRLARALGTQGEPYLLEANPIPQLQRIRGEFSLVAESRGGTFQDVVARILASAITRAGLRA
jgi:D-alanine-D-alanine ligase